MATEDKGKSGAAEPPKGPEGPPAAKGAGRGERSLVTDRDIEAALQRMDPARLRSILVGREAAARGPASPKYSVALDAVPPGDADEVIEAFSDAMAILDNGDDDARANPDEAANIRAQAQVKALARVRDASASVAQAAEVNSNYRSKPLRHSFLVGRARLEMKRKGAAHA